MDTIKKVILVAILICGIMPLTHGTPDLVFAKNEQTMNDNLYDLVNEHIVNYEENFTIEYEGNTKALDQQLQNVMQKIKEENVYVYENISKWRSNFTYTTTKATIKFTVSYLTNYSQEQFVNEEIKRLANELMRTNKSDLEKIKAAHDYAVLNIEYSSETAASQYTAYALLTEGKAVCQGYAFFIYRLLQEMEFPVKYVKGYAGTELHGWNLVQINGEWYHLDATWDDPIPDRKDQVRYKYFLLSDKKISQTHSWERTMYPIANSEKYAPFHVATEAYTVNHQLFYRNVKNRELYVMNLKTMRSAKVTSDYFVSKINSVASLK